VAGKARGTEAAGHFGQLPEKSLRLVYRIFYLAISKLVMDFLRRHQALPPNIFSALLFNSFEYHRS
jgi:hypothetical protein